MAEKEKIFNNGFNGILGNTHSMVLTALLLAAALVLSIIENMLPPLPIAVPGVKFGLSNIAVMYALFFLGYRKAYIIAVLKGLFAAVTRGVIAGVLSLFGGIISVTVMVLLLFIFRERISYLIVSVFGAISHNIGQFIVITLIFEGMNMWAYFPILLISGLIAGIITSTLLKLILPAFKRLI